MTVAEEFKIDVDAVLEAKNPRLAKKMPGFVKRYLKRIVHQDEINAFMKANPELQGMDFVRDTIAYMGLKIEVEGFENVPETGRFVFAANHPLGGLESIVLMSVISKKFTNFRFVVNDILMFMKPLASLFVPVNKHGSQSREGLSAINDIYSSEHQILYFPAGLVSRKIKGEIKDLTWQKSFINKAIEYKRDIIPVYIAGRNSNFFYNLAKLRKFFGIKANIEMLYLVNEMMKQKGNTIKLVFGEPVSYTSLNKSKNPMEWAEYLRSLTYSLKK